MILLHIRFAGDDRLYRFVASEKVPYLTSVRKMVDLRGRPVTDILFPTEVEFFGDDHTLPIDGVPA